jgi:hypothetical protein
METIAPSIGMWPIGFQNRRCATEDMKLKRRHDRRARISIPTFPTMPAIRRPRTLWGPRTPARQTRRRSTRKDEDKEAKALLDARVQRLKDCVVAFDALVNKRKELGGPLRLYLSCVIAYRPLPVDGLSFVQHQKAFQGYFDAGMRRPFLFPRELNLIPNTQLTSTSPTSPRSSPWTSLGPVFSR